MDEHHRAARAFELLVQEASEPESWWWLSFADGSLPEGQQFLGVAIVREHGPARAIRRSHELGINPGGEVRFMACTDEAIAEKVPVEAREVLLSRERLVELALVDA